MYINHCKKINHQRFNFFPYHDIFPILTFTLIMTLPIVTAGAICQQGIFTPPWHMIPSLSFWGSVLFCFLLFGFLRWFTVCYCHFFMKRDTERERKVCINLCSRKLNKGFIRYKLFTHYMVKRIFISSLQRFTLIANSTLKEQFRVLNGYFTA